MYASKNISIAWYMRSVGSAENALSLELDQIPTTLTLVALPKEQKPLIQHAKKSLAEYKNPTPQDASVSNKIQKIPGTGMESAKMKQEFFEYAYGKECFLMIEANYFEREHQVDVIYLYSLSSFWQHVRAQRLWFAFIWLASLAGLYLFSYAFTSRVLQPLIQNDKKQKRFIAFASHELRSPLAVFKTGLSLLKASPGDGKSERIFSLLDTEMLRMERLLQDLLCLSKMEQASLPFQFQRISLAELLHSIYEKYAPIAAQKPLSLTLSIEGKGECHCFCDPQRIEQAVVILLDNALSYTPPGQSVDLRLSGQCGKSCIQVADTGIGIPDDAKGKIFDKFYRLDPSHSQKEHFGLGLSIAKEICSAHGGKISVCDTAGGGSTFTITLPNRRESQPIRNP